MNNIHPCNHYCNHYCYFYYFSFTSSSTASSSSPSLQIGWQSTRPGPWGGVLVLVLVLVLLLLPLLATDRIALDSQWKARVPPCVVSPGIRQI